MAAFKGSCLLLVWLLCTLATVLAWDKDDQCVVLHPPKSKTYKLISEHSEIFELVSSLEAAEGKGTTFYSFLNVTKAASPADVNRAARRRSLELHPDKNPGVKGAEERFARLGVIIGILRDQEKRKRYNYFHDNGVPRWKGTGYMYSRWQPGLPFALSIVLLFATLAQYGVQRSTYRSELVRISRFQRAARLTAYGPKPPPSTSAERKKVRVPIQAGRVDAEVVDDEEGSSAGTTGSRAARRAAAAAGAGGAKGKKQAVGGATMVTMVVEGEKVWILTEDNSELPLDASAATRPSLLTTFLPNLVRRLVAKARAPVSRGVATNGVPSATEAGEEDLVAEEGSDEVPTLAEQAAKGGGAGIKKRKAKQRR